MNCRMVCHFAMTAALLLARFVSQYVVLRFHGRGSVGDELAGGKHPGGIFLDVSFLYRPASCTAPAPRHCCPRNSVRTPGGMVTEYEVAVSYKLQRAWRSGRCVSGPVPAGGVVIPVVL